MADSDWRAGKTIRVRGTVQGVGFRPTVWRLAREYGLVGSVCNDAAGVTIKAWGTPAALAEFVRQIPLQAPPLAKITGMHYTDTAEPPDTDQFSIVASRTGTVQTSVAADAATCPACLAEIADPANRRYRYPFTNCTHCGPRLSIVRGIPYDRANTSMAAFELCPACRAEYENPADRRFHAQPNACPACGPRLWLKTITQEKAVKFSSEITSAYGSHALRGNDVSGEGAGLMTYSSDPLAAAAELIRLGRIVAIKGLGGFHLACDAANQQAVAALRDRKLRYAKPFAIMARDIAMLADYVAITPLERQALTEIAAPIVILDKQGKALADAVAPGDATLGCMLPYTPLHHLLMQALDAPIVLTSGNRSDEPQCIDNDDARERLAGIADAWLLHDRAIVNRLDDSVLRVMAGQPRMLRRARGYAPQPLALPPGFEQSPAILAMGGELKNTFCLLKDGQAILSPHIGDLENALVQQDYRQQLALYQQLFDCPPQAIAVDWHDDYLSSQLGRQWAQQQNLPLIAVQHHHAHIAACMAEHGLAIDHPPLLGVAMDGLGLGDGGLLWGGEFLRVDYRHFTRLAAFDAVPLLGGAQAMRQPWRNSYAQLKRYFDWHQLSQDYAGLELIQFLNRQPLEILDAMLSKQLNSPLSSSCGRLFDAFAAALGLCCETVSHEGQAAMALETLASPVFEQQRQYAYSYQQHNDGRILRLSWHCFWQQLLDDCQRGVAKADIAARIHHGLAQAIANTALTLAEAIGSDTIVLSGGVFQNRLLLEEASRLLSAAEKKVLAASKLPSNDGGLSLGQTAVAAARLMTQTL